MNFRPARGELSYYRTALEYYSDELLRLDAHLRLLVARDRNQSNSTASADNPMRGMFLSEDEIGRLLQSQFQPTDTAAETSLQQEVKDWDIRLQHKTRETIKAGVYVPLLHLSRVFQLSDFEKDLLFMIFSIELNPKYEKIYAYLNDNVHTAGVTMELATRCFNPGETEKLLSRAGWTEDLTIVRYLLDGHVRALGSQHPLSLDSRVVRFLSNVHGLDKHTAEPIQFRETDNLSPLVIQQEIQKQLIHFVSVREDVSLLQDHNVYFQLIGPKGAGKQLQALHFCRHYQKPFVQLDLTDVPVNLESASSIIRSLVREAVLQDGIIGIRSFEQVNKEGTTFLRQLLLRELAIFSGYVFFLSADRIRLSDYADQGIVMELALPVPSTFERNLLWQMNLNGVTLEDDCLNDIATKFRLTPGQIQSAARNALAQSLWSDSVRLKPSVSAADLHHACYQQSEHQLGARAVRLTPRYGFRDLVLPEAQLQLLKNACNHMTQRAKVYEEWGFAKRIAYGRGIAMLFSGPPGTGKTMGAEVMGFELGMEVYKIDVAQVISKYIGETEKNLREVFQEASRSQAILFFDEADALFGKRSEVKDAHDKYSNVETAFLLQQMEQYEGITVLATNLYQNIDEAFIRRFTYVVKFPFPDEVYREKIWRDMFPAQAPVDEDVDFLFLAKKFSISGGLIKNIALGAAFLAASNGVEIGMRQILLTARDELNKLGTLFRIDDLGPYADLLETK